MHRCRFVLDSFFFFFWLCSWMLQEVGYWGCRTVGGTPAPVGELSPRGGCSRRPLHPWDQLRWPFPLLFHFFWYQKCVFRG